MTMIGKRRRFQLGETVRELSEHGLVTTKIVYQPDGAVELHTRASDGPEGGSVADEISRVLGGS